MVKLQNNFTTPEQSKRLLELGVPADSADFYYSEFTSEAHIVGPLVINCSTFTEEQNFFPLDKMLPCWSVGRLIEIWEVVTGEKWLHETEQPIIEELISNFNYYSYDNDDPLDFSKLNK